MLKVKPGALKAGSQVTKSLVPPTTFQAYAYIMSSLVVPVEE